MRRPVTCRRCGRVIKQGQVMGVWVLSNGLVKLQVRYQCPRCQFEGYVTLPPDIWAGARLVWEVPLTELSLEEMERFAQLLPITIDDVLNFYDSLKYIDRIPRALFERLSSPPKINAKFVPSPKFQKQLPRRGES